MHGDAAESIRRTALANEYLKKNPARKSLLRREIENQVATGFLYGYQKACEDLLTPKDTPGTPATAITLLNRVGQMVLRTRAELLKTPTPRPQCAGCFCIMQDDRDKAAGWCLNCAPNAERLILQVADLLRATPEDNTMAAGAPTKEG